MPDTRLRSLTFAVAVILAPALDGCSSDGGRLTLLNSITTGAYFDCSKSIEEFCAGFGSCD
jgi:hypothetical protein